MRTTTLLLLIASTSAFTFAPPSASRGVAGRTKLFMADVAKTVPIVITGNNIEVTPALMDYVNKKLDRTLGKLSNSGAILECDVHLSVNKNPKVSTACIIHHHHDGYSQSRCVRITSYYGVTPMAGFGSTFFLSVHLLQLQVGNNYAAELKLYTHVTIGASIQINDLVTIHIGQERS